MSELVLRVNPILCDGHGLCAELLPERIELDEWGYPIIAETPVTAPGSSCTRAGPSMPAPCSRSTSSAAAPLASGSPPFGCLPAPETGRHSSLNRGTANEGVHALETKAK